MIFYIKKFFRKFFDVIVRNFHKSKFSTGSLSVFLENFIAICRKKKVRFNFSKKNNIYSVVEINKKINFSHKLRGISLYRNGIDERGKFIFSSYCLDNINFVKGDVVIDCGANFGDLMLKLSEFIMPSNYIAIEPNPSSFEMLKKNVSNKSILINKALGNSNNNLPFYVSSEDADSSIIQPAKYTEIINVPVIRLDDLVAELSIKKIKLLKIEAEGYEPEILQGLGKSINICEYIAIDGGYERGVHKEQTFTTQANFLLNNGFKMIDIYFPYCRALFMNTNFN